MLSRETVRAYACMGSSGSQPVLSNTWAHFVPHNCLRLQPSLLCAELDSFRTQDSLNVYCDTSNPCQKNLQLLEPHHLHAFPTGDYHSTESHNLNHMLREPTTALMKHSRVSSDTSDDTSSEKGGLLPPFRL